MDDKRVEAAQKCKEAFCEIKKELCVIDAKIKAAIKEYHESKPEEKYTFEMEKTMDKLAFMAAAIYDNAHGKPCCYDVNDPVYQRSMLRRIRKALAIYDSLDPEKAKFNLVKNVNRQKAINHE